MKWTDGYKKSKLKQLGLPGGTGYSILLRSIKNERNIIRGKS
jgi:hypothetical protein